VLVSKDGSSITGFKQTIQAIYIESAAKEGVAMLLDIRKICDASKLQKTFSHSPKYNDYESYVVFENEAILNITSALAAVFVLLILFTANLAVSIFVLACVGLVDLYLLALLYFWDVTLNSVTIVNCVIAIGLAVDYSAHIGHAYLTVEPPEEIDGKPLTN
jgi:predicted RND superfamily exporter protein